jgi:hypothetical protein
MAEGHSVTVADVVAKTIDGRLEDFAREAVALVARELMEAEISGEIGAELGEVARGETRVKLCPIRAPVRLAGVGAARLLGCYSAV